MRTPARNLVTAALIAAGVVSAAAPAAAQSNRELQRDWREVRDERRDLRDAQRYGNYRNVADARDDLRDARRDYREDLGDRYGRIDWRRDGWRGDRTGHRDLYARGGWNAPVGYNAFVPAARNAPAFYGRGHRVADPYR